MDFEAAALRLQKDQAKLRGRRGKNTIVVSEKAKKEADYRRKQQQLLKEKRDKEQAHGRFVEKYMTECNRLLGVRQLKADGLLLNATSIHGDGDKIALPPSVLESLTSSMSGDDQQSTSPWMFRVGVLKPDYSFPASKTIMAMRIPSDDDDDDDSMGEDEEGDAARSEYLDELSEKYISYSHATVVEFTQDEGHIGLPSSIAAALLQGTSLSVTRTKDPATAGDGGPGSSSDDDNTPGHLAWGKFDVPNSPIEVSLVKLPKGRGCTLVPTLNAIQNGFHKLKDVKLVLEQSLIRTRATMSLGDIVHTWHRGIKYDLNVTSVTPATFQAVACINTDIEVDIGANEDAIIPEPSPPNGDAEHKPEVQSLGGGRTLSHDYFSAAATAAPLQMRPDIVLPIEPPLDQKEGVCTIQIRADKGAGRRRFEVDVSNVGHVFAFAASFTTATSFHLVTRFPRRVFSMEHFDQTLASSGFVQGGQELLMVERL